MMPRWMRCMLLAMMVAPLAAGVSPWQGMTDSGLRFQGSFSRISQDRLFLESSGSDPSLQFGIPLDEIKWIHWTGAEHEPGQLLQELEFASPLLRLLAGETMARLEAALHELAASGEWRRLIRWTTRLVELERIDLNHGRFRLLHAWSLLELGLQGEGRQWIATLISETDPLETDPRLCWLAGRAALLDNKLKEAAFWAGLPMVRIPVVAGPIERDLRELRQSITDQERLEK